MFSVVTVLITVAAILFAIPIAVRYYAVVVDTSVDRSFSIEILQFRRFGAWCNELPEDATDVRRQMALFEFEDDTPIFRDWCEYTRPVWIRERTVTSDTGDWPHFVPARSDGEEGTQRVVPGSQQESCRVNINIYRHQFPFYMSYRDNYTIDVPCSRIPDFQEITYWHLTSRMFLATTPKQEAMSHDRLTNPVANEELLQLLEESHVNYDTEPLRLIWWTTKE